MFKIFFIKNNFIKNDDEPCNVTSDCIENNYCSKNGFCEHKDFFPLADIEIIGILLIFFTSALSNAGGVGGGGLVIPILLLMFKFYTHEAIPVSKLTIFMGAVTSFILNFGQLHPERKAISIDYNIPYLIVPMLLFGTMCGISLNKVMPPWIILISLTILLFMNTYKTLTKAKSLRQKEIDDEKNNLDKEVKNDMKKIISSSEISPQTTAGNVNVNICIDSTNFDSNKTDKEMQISK